jgi:hypothetical protein
MVRMRPDVFIKLAGRMRELGVKNTNLLGVEEKLLILLLVFYAHRTLRKISRLAPPSQFPIYPD